MMMQSRIAAFKSAPSPMLNITLRTLLHVKPFRLMINLLEPLRLFKDLELQRVIFETIIYKVMGLQSSIQA
jgi:hypothetical protein